MRTKIDWYIHRATLGLPTQERVDTAAELRVHLNNRTKELMLEGHTKEEAEYLAVDAMGAVHVTNQQLLGHWFTPKRGWATLALVVVGCATWFGAKAYFEQPVFQKPSAELADLNYIIGDTQVVEINIPKGAQSKFIALYDPRIGQYMFSHGNLESGFGTNSLTTKTRIAITLKAGEDCKKQRLYIKAQDFANNQPTFGLATPLPVQCNLDVGEVNNYNITSLIQPGQEVLLGKWQPIFRFSPSIKVPGKENIGLSSTQSPTINTDTLMQVYFSRTRLRDPSDRTDYSPPPFWNFAIQNLVYTSEPSYTESSMRAFDPPKHAKTMRAVVFQNGRRYKGVELNINDKQRIQIHAATSKCFPSCGPDANITSFHINPGAASLDTLFDFEKSAKKPSNDIGAYVLALPLPKTFKLEQWYPIYVLPTHEKTDDLPIHITGKPNDWFVMMVHFSNKASPETTKLPQPPDMPTRFRLRAPFQPGNLEIAQKPIPSSKPKGTAARKP